MTTQSIFHKRSHKVNSVKVFPDSLPQKTDVWCWWCCHPFTCHPVSIPLSHDPTKDLFELVGVFCSFSCCKSYIMSSNQYNKPIIISNIKTLAKRMGLPYKNKIIAAPPRQTLNVFGGYLTIDEFRKNNNVAISLLSSNHYIITQRFEDKPVQNISIDAPINYKKSQEEKKEMFALKRTKPLKKNKGTLEAAMGLTVK